MAQPTFGQYIQQQNVGTQINQDIPPTGIDGLYAEQQMAGAPQNEQVMLDPNMDPRLQQQIMEQQQRALHHTQENPFAVEQYKNVGVPDVPIQFGGGIAESLLNDSEVPEEIKKKYWFIFHKDNVLTFLDEARQSRKLLNFDIMKIDILNAIPYYDYTFERELEFDVLRNVFETKLDRALGTKGNNVKNERIMLQSQFQEQRQISEDGNRSQIREGFFKRLLGRR